MQLEQDIRKAIVFLREHNNTIPTEVLDFMRDVAVKAAREMDAPVLNEIQLQELKRKAQHDEPIGELAESQKKQFFAYMMKEAEAYSNTHSMRYSIMRSATKAVFN